MTRENLGYLKCTKCGWIHFRMSRDYAEASVKSFNDYYDTLSPVEQEQHYGGEKSSISSYERCFLCGTSNQDSVEAMESEVPFGSTVQPMIASDDYPRANLKKK